ncbi:GSCOCG00007215001-RA-CDS, partial [Cotesia congregata]
MSSITPSTKKQYEKPIREWVSFCKKNNYNIFSPNEQEVMEWLVEKFNEVLSYSAFKTRPSKPKYDRIYSLDPILKKLESMYPLDELSLQKLTIKLIMILALITAHRKQTFSLIKRNNIKKTSNGYEIEISDAIKTSRPGSCQPLLILPKFYLNVTNMLVTTNSLFITTKRPYRDASKDTISRWIKTFLRECGIGPEYVPHSVR